MNAGGLWDESQKIYPLFGGVPNRGRVEWLFPSGAKIQFRHLEYEHNVYHWNGSQIAFIGFDEVSEMEESQFWYLMSRNRTTCGVRPYLRCSTNPEAESWVARLIKWWLDELGYPDPEKAGVVRYFVRLDEQLHWFDTKQMAIDHAMAFGIDEREAQVMPKSFTFVPASLDDNPTLLRDNPEYRANLLAMTTVDRERLLRGNWFVRPHVGELFPRSGWGKVAAAPLENLYLCRAWDKAGTEGGRGSRTAGVLMGCHADTGVWYVIHCTAGRWNDITRDNLIASIAERDDRIYGQVSVMLEQEGGSGGKDSALATARRLRGRDVRIKTVTGDKVSRWRALAAQVQAGNVKLVDDGNWDVEDFVREMDALSGDPQTDKNRLKDYADAASLAFNFICQATSDILPDELLCSGDPEGLAEESRPLNEEQVRELPPVIAGILRDARRGARDRDEPRKGPRRRFGWF